MFNKQFSTGLVLCMAVGLGLLFFGAGCESTGGKKTDDQANGHAKDHSSAPATPEDSLQAFAKSMEAFDLDEVKKRSIGLDWDYDRLGAVFNVARENKAFYDAYIERFGNDALSEMSRETRGNLTTDTSMFPPGFLTNVKFTINGDQATAPIGPQTIHMVQTNGNWLFDITKGNRGSEEESKKVVKIFTKMADITKNWRGQISQKHWKAKSFIKGYEKAIRDGASFATARPRTPPKDEYGEDDDDDSFEEEW